MKRGKISSVMMDLIVWDDSFNPKPLKSPLMMVALEGLFDIAEGATNALRHLVDHTDARQIATIISEEFFDFTSERPTMKLVAGQRRVIWPDTKVFWAPSGERSQHDLIFAVGVEPHLRWDTFAGCLLDIAASLGAATVVTLGSPPGQAPHTRPLGVVGSTTNHELATRLGLQKPTYEGPTGLVGVLHEKLDRAKIPSFSLKVSVPHYVTSPPNPEASRSLLARLELITGVDTGHAELEEAALQWRERIDSAVASDDEIAYYVQALEKTVDSSEDMLPSGSELAEQMEAFLRGQTDEG